MQKMSLSDQTVGLTKWSPNWLNERVILMYWLSALCILAIPFVLVNHLFNSERLEILGYNPEIVQVPCGNHTHDAIEIKYLNIEGKKASKLIRLEDYHLNPKNPNFINQVRINQNHLFKYTWHNNGIIVAILTAVVCAISLIVLISVVIISSWEDSIPKKRRTGYIMFSIWEKLGVDIRKTTICDYLDGGTNDEIYYYVRRALWFREFWR